MAIERVITKQLGGIEDLTLGNATEVQSRGGVNKTLTQVGGASLPYNAVGGDSIKTAIDAAQTDATAATVVADAADTKADAALTALDTKVDLTSATGSAALPSGTTAQRDVTPLEGYSRINTDLSVLEVYTGGSWVSFGSVADLITTNVTHNITVDADYTLTVAQNFYGRITITDTSVFLTTGRNILIGATERTLFVKNSTLQTLTFKTVAGTGIAVLPGDSKELLNDSTNIILPENTTYPLQMNYPMLSGDANLGDVTYSVTAAIAAGVYQFKNLTLNSGVVLTTTETVDSYLTFIVQGTFTYAGVINLDGVGGAGGAGGLGDGTLSTPGSDKLVGAGGGSGGNAGVVGNNGGKCSPLAGGIVPVTINTDGTNGESYSVLTSGEEYIRERLTLEVFTINGGGGGGGGGRNGGDRGGNGGKGGGGLVIICDTFDFQATGAFSAAGANGEVITGTGAGGGGGGGGAMLVFARHVLNDLGGVSMAGGIGAIKTYDGGNGGEGYYVLITPTTRAERTA